jgi:hypothetical protein
MSLTKTTTSCLKKSWLKNILDTDSFLSLHVSDYLRSKKWAERLSQWAAQGLHEVYFFVHEPDDINSPEMAQQVILDLNEEAGANLSPLQWVHS